MSLLRSDPFPHVVADGWTDPGLVRSASNEWPSSDWQWWVRYNDDRQRKRACADWKVIPPTCQRLLSQMLLVPVKEWFGASGTIIPDTLLWGGGLHAMSQGDRLGIHLDHSHHPFTGLERVFSAVLFLDDWRSSWGGQLALWDAGRQRIVKAFEPRAGRLVVFRTGDVSYHSVLPLLKCPENVTRKSLAVFFHAETARPLVRPRAQFFEVVS